MLIGDMGFAVTIYRDGVEEAGRVRPGFYKLDSPRNAIIVGIMQIVAAGSIGDMRCVGLIECERRTRAHTAVYWLDAYGGGIFLPFADATSGSTTYGGGRYLLDTVKGADLGSAGERLVVDLNYAYHPSCVYSSDWSCPLAPPANRLDVAIAAGERLPA